MECYVGSISGFQILGTVAKEPGRILQKGKGVLDLGGPQADLDLLLKCFFLSLYFLEFLLAVFQSSEFSLKVLGPASFSLSILMLVIALHVPERQNRGYRECQRHYPLLARK